MKYLTCNLSMFLFNVFYPEVTFEKERKKEKEKKGGRKDEKKTDRKKQTKSRI